MIRGKASSEPNKTSSRVRPQIHSTITRLNQKVFSVLRQSHHIIGNHRKPAARKRSRRGGLACTREAYQRNRMFTDGDGTRVQARHFTQAQNESDHRSEQIGAGIF